MRADFALHAAGAAAVGVATVVAAVAGCSSESTTATPPSSDAGDAGDSGSTSAVDDAARFDACTCGDAPEDPAPGLGCSRERTILRRICIVDAECNVVPYVPPTQAGTAEVHPVKGAFAVVIELAEAIRADVEVAANEPPIPPRETFRRGISLFAEKDWSSENGPLSRDPANEAAAKTRVDAERKKVVLVPTSEMKGTWAIETVLGFDPWWGEDVCGEPENSSVGYTARHSLALE